MKHLSRGRARRSLKIKDLKGGFLREKKSRESLPTGETGLPTLGCTPQ